MKLSRLASTTVRNHTSPRPSTLAKRFETASEVHPFDKGGKRDNSVLIAQTAICVVDETGRKLTEAKVVTCPDAVTTWLRDKTATLTKVGMETGPLAVWLWNELSRRGLPIVCFDARRTQLRHEA